MIKRLLSSAIFALLLLLPTVTVFAAGAEENNSTTSDPSLMNGPFIILAFATIIAMIYYALRD